MSEPDEERPPLTAALSGSELRRWYWLQAELVPFARSSGVRTSGSKDLLTARLAAHLDGLPFSEPDTRRPSARQPLAPPFDLDDVIPAGQRCGQALREWFTAEVGTGFRFDGAMREFFARADGSQTLGDAVAHWHRTRTDVPSTIDAQFEYNRFTRRWHDDHPDGDAADLRAAWWRYRSLPVDHRGRA